MANTEPSLLPPAPGRPELLFLSIKGVPNTMLDSTLRRFLLTRASDAVVLNGELARYGGLVGLFKLEFPSINVLRYTNAQRIPASTRVASTMYCHFLEHANTQILQLRSGVPKIDGDGTIWTDITNPDTRNFIVSHLARQIAAHGADGVFIDSFHTDLHDPETYVDGDLKSSQWPNACKQLLQALQAALPGKQIWFNGLWPFTPELLEAQTELLKWADGASMEFYGYDGRPNGTSNGSFETFVERLNAVLTAHPDKPILVRGTPMGDSYYHYETDLQQARYCYGCYLLANTPRSAFSYGQSFQLTRLPRHRTGGATMFSYFELPLGNPAGPAVQNGTGGWSRSYAGGAVFVAPAKGGTQTWQLTSDWWTTLGNKIPAGTPLVLDRGDAAFLLRRRLQPPPAELEVDLKGAANDTLVEGATGEWLLQGVTGEYHYLQMFLTVRSEDPESAVLVRFETNDNDNMNPRRPFGILTILPDAEGKAVDPGNRDYPYGQNTTLGALHVTSSLRYPTTGRSFPISLNLRDECHPFLCFRVISVRAIGSVTVERIRLGKLSPISDGDA